MLEKLLDQISTGGTFSLNELALKLGVTEPLVEMMIADLVKAGRLKPVEICSKDGCQICPQAGGCTPAGVRLWTSGSRK